MKETDYAYAVGRIRVNEMSFLSAADMDQLIMADSYRSAITLLEEKGWMEKSEHPDPVDVFRLQEEKTWKLLTEIAPDIRELDFLIVKNDFHNLKAILKAAAARTSKAVIHDPEALFVYPVSIDPKQLSALIAERDFEHLPAFARDVVKETYDSLMRTEDGQWADLILDAKAMAEIQTRSETVQNRFVAELAELTVATLNIKIAYRAILTGKDRRFLEAALGPMKSLDRTKFIDATLLGFESLIEMLSPTVYGPGAEALKVSGSAFEKWCDDALMAKVAHAKYKSLGIEPLIAYYVAKTTEIKNIRILLSCKSNRFAPEVIRERMRRLYV